LGDRERTSVKVFVWFGFAGIPTRLSKEIQEVRIEVEVKETWYGLVIHGERQNIDKAVELLRSKYPVGVFIKESAPYIRRRRVFSGFLQAAADYELLPLISEALQSQQNKAPQKEVSSIIPHKKAIVGVRVMRCPLFLGRGVEALLIYCDNNDVLVRCPDGKNYCLWYSHVSCPYGYLEHNLEKWYLSGTIYSLLNPTRDSYQCL